VVTPLPLVTRRAVRNHLVQTLLFGQHIYIYVCIYIYIYIYSVCVCVACSFWPAVFAHVTYVGSNAYTICIVCVCVLPGHGHVLSKCMFSLCKLLLCHCACFLYALTQYSIGHPMHNSRVTYQCLMQGPCHARA